MKNVTALLEHWAIYGKLARRNACEIDNWDSHLVIWKEEQDTFATLSNGQCTYACEGMSLGSDVPWGTMNFKFWMRAKSLRLQPVVIAYPSNPSNTITKTSRKGHDLKLNLKDKRSLMFC